LRISVAALGQTSGLCTTFLLKQHFEDISLTGETVTFITPVELEVEALKKGRSVLFDGTIRTTVNMVCSRCLKNFELPIQTEYREKFYQMAGTKVEQHIDTDEIHLFSGEIIDLTDTVQESLLLALPMKVLCRSDCSGICPLCGGDLNQRVCDCKNESTDQRLAILQQLMKNRKEG